MQNSLTFIFLLIGAVAFGQTEKGSLQFNMMGGIERQNSQNINYFSSSANLEVGYAPCNNFFIGVHYLPIFSTHSSAQTKFSLGSYGVYLRQYFLKNKNRLYIHTGLSQFNLNVGGTYSGFAQNTRWSLGIGHNYFIGNSIAIETQLTHYIYNKTVKYTKAKAGSEIRNDRISNFFSLRLGVKFYINTYSKDEQTIGPFSLENRYLKAGNKSIALDGSSSIYPPTYVYTGHFKKSKFLTNTTRIHHNIIGEAYFAKKLGKEGTTGYQPQIERYYPIGNKLYFTPIVGVGPLISHSTRNKNFLTIGWSGLVKASITYFTKSAKIDIGMAFNSIDYFKKGKAFGLSAELLLDTELFINKNLAIKPMLFYNVRSKPSSNLVFQNPNHEYFNDFRFQFGMSFYY
ncbi:MAG: hypothetical protein IT258_09815 [Saprospiraceae bacterium]|nr:hypothetical protein [Saprospiraceae bacterium]